MSAFAFVPLCRFLSHSGSSGSKPRPPPQPRRYVHLSTMTMSSVYCIYWCILYIVFSRSNLTYPSTFQCFSRWRQQRSIDALRSGESGRLESNRGTSHILELTRARRPYVSLGTPLMLTVLLAALLILLLWWQPQDGSIRFRIKVARNPTRPQSEWRSQEKQVPEEGLSKGTTASPTVGNKGWLTTVNAGVCYTSTRRCKLLISGTFHCVWIACNWCHGGRKTAKRDLGKLAARLGQGRQRFGTRETAARSNRAEARWGWAGRSGDREGEGEVQICGGNELYGKGLRSPRAFLVTCFVVIIWVLYRFFLNLESLGNILQTSVFIQIFCRILAGLSLMHGSFLFYRNGPNMLPKYVKTVSLSFMTVQVSECKKRPQWKRWKWGWWGKKVHLFSQNSLFCAFILTDECMCVFLFRRVYTAATSVPWQCLD